MWHDDITGTEWTVVGAPTDNSFAGAAYIFSRSPGDTAWHQEANLVADDAVVNDEFGHAVAIDHDTVVVSAPFHEADFFVGAAYVFVRDAATGTWSKQGDTLMRGTGNFGMSVAIAGDELGVGEPDWERVHLYSRTAGVWSLDTVITPTGVSSSSAFGSAIAFDGSQLIVGAPEDSTVAAIQGSALVYASSRGGWDLKGVLRPASETNTFELFGTSVALAGDTAVVGAPWQDDAKGAAHVFIYDDAASTWGESQVLESSDATDSAGFGSSVAAAGDTIAVGSPGNDRAYVFGEKSGSWIQISELNGDSKTFFGGSIADDGQAVIVGAPVIDSGTGRAYVFINDRIFADGFD